MAKQLAYLIADVYRDLGDEPREVFTDMQVEEFIRAGIAEVNRVAPIELKETLALQQDVATGFTTLVEFQTLSELVYRAEIERIANGWRVPIPAMREDETGVTGWVFRKNMMGGGIIEFPKWWISRINGNLNRINLFGYGPRAQAALGDVFAFVNLSDADEYSVRAFCRAEGFDMLAHDRSLFTQWVGQTNNTDVSPTQMMQMAAGARSEWDRQRGLIRVVRRYA